ncbi:hypothetical protein [Mesorhizobium sp.]|uniref:hypothetical protein n=1 Tax=Mesorhizobium sp. TaxID=1871066 RepID=UPI0011FD38E2|nr:hypothetical protein [Mesorhizobium sp.]TIX26667.1 MAG: hypothetical protein E5V35_09675 [Mesorhizobium sp.]
MFDAESVVDTYCKAWFDPEPEERRRLLFASFEPEGIYTDPTVHISGAEALLEHIDQVLKARPGFWLERTTLIDVHHDFLRFGWVQRGENGFRGADSMDMCRVSEQGKLSLVVGFFGPFRAMPNS